MNNNTLKFISVSLIIVVMVCLAIAKCIYPTLETTLLDSTLLQLLAALGVYHAVQQPPKDPNA